ncbi:MAG: hypothetical protein ISS71_08405 [Phycisphaerae bacterium]|nr:hypothetical protein [Phycisphaerae bacterium]
MKQIFQELKIHSPFTLLGASTGIVLMLLGRAFLVGQEHTLFAVFHPLHVLLSAMVTAALFEIHRKAKNFLMILVIGIVGSIGVATLSDCILPFFGETILGVAVPTHASLHEEGHEHEDAAMAQHPEEAHHPKWHIGFVEEWYLVFPAAVLGVLLAYFKPTTHLPHASHVLVSTWASSAHILMNTHADISLMLLVGMFVVLFLSVWLPCCVSDIVFPLLFVRSDGAHLGHSCILCGKKENGGSGVAATKKTDSSLRSE